MASAAVRRPLPALISLVALLLLTALVWWRVLHRGTSSDAAAAPKSCASTQAAPALTLPAPSSITLTVLNATTRNGIATKARSTLTGYGFRIPQAAGNASHKNHVRAPAQIQYGPRAKQAATLVRYYFPGATLRATHSSTAVVQVLLGNRYRGVATPSTVKRALDGDKISIASAAPTATSTATC